MQQGPKTSAPLLRAASKEIDRLSRERERVRTRSRSLEDKLRAVEKEMSALDERIKLLRKLADPQQVSDARERVPVGARANHALRGPDIRETAVRILANRDDAEAPVHYRDWLELLHSAGYLVEGAEERAVFLSQISRSPLVSKTTKAGVYQLDLDAPERLHAQLARLKAELTEANAGDPGAPTDLAKLRDRRKRLNVRIGQVSRALEEADRLLGDARLRVIEGAGS